jgi:hypothetical protein
MKRVLRVLCVFSCATGVFAQTQIDLRTQGKSVDFSGASATKPMQTGSALPSNCGVGETFFLTTAPAGANFYACTTTGHWSPPGSGAVDTVAGKSGDVVLQASDLADCRLTLTSPTVLSFNNCPFSYPDVPQQIIPAGSMTLLAGSGTAYVTPHREKA